MTVSCNLYLPKFRNFSTETKFPKKHNFQESQQNPLVFKGQVRLEVNDYDIEAM